MVDLRKKLIDILVDFKDEYISINEAADTLVQMFGKHRGPKEIREESEKLKEEFISDGWQDWSIRCPECRKKSIEIVRPGKVQCHNCG